MPDFEIPKIAVFWKFIEKYNLDYKEIKVGRNSLYYISVDDYSRCMISELMDQE